MKITSAKKVTAVLSLLCVLGSFNVPKANAGVVMALVGHNVANSGLDGVVMGGTLMLGGVFTVIGGAITGNVSTLVLDAEEGNNVPLVEAELADKFPFIDDAYALRVLSSDVVEARNRGEGIAHSEYIFEALVPEKKVLEALEPTMMSDVEIKTVVNFLSRPIEL